MLLLLTVTLLDQSIVLGLRPFQTHLPQVMVSLNTVISDISMALVTFLHQMHHVRLLYPDVEMDWWYQIWISICVGNWRTNGVSEWLVDMNFIKICLLVTWSLSLSPKLFLINQCIKAFCKRHCVIWFWQLWQVVICVYQWNNLWMLLVISNKTLIFIVASP